MEPNTSTWINSVIALVGLLGGIGSFIISLRKAKPEISRIESETDDLQVGVVRKTLENSDTLANQVKGLLEEIAALRAENNRLVSKHTKTVQAAIKLIQQIQKAGLEPCVTVEDLGISNGK